jgi:hypothetical protein
MRNLCVAVGLALCTTSVLAADFGVGISARSDDGLVYVPIDISKTFRIEPSVRYVSSNLSFSQDAAADGPDSESDSESWEIGIGAFGLKQIAETAHIYYGVRAAYVDVKATSTDTSFGLPVRSETNQDGYRIGPTLGFEYLFGQHFSVGGEASYTFLDVDGESKSRLGAISESVTTVEQKTHGTQTRLIFRYMF